ARKSDRPAPIDRGRACFGVQGLDDVLGGGLPRNHLYLLDGEPGTGKTTLAMQFLLEGRARGERALYVTLSETAEELTSAATSHGWSVDGIVILELAAVQGEKPDEVYTLFQPAEIELQHTVETVLAEVDRHQPDRVVFDSLSEMRMLARDPLRFRRQILMLKQFFVGRECTVLLLDDRSHPSGDLQLQSLAHGVILLEHVALEYGAERRKLQIMKLRGAPYRGGYHDFRIRTGGVEVYPRILRHTRQADEQVPTFSSGSKGLDALIGGRILGGTSTLLMGSAGTGKSIISMQYARQAATEGLKARVYMFDERITTALLRAKGLGIDAADALADGRLTLRQVEPTEMSPGEFAQDIVRAVEKEDVRLISIDSINGYLQAMPAERLLVIQVHELLSYLADRGVAIIMTLVQHGVFGAQIEGAAEVSYLADTVLLLRYFEYAGMVRRAISVVKKRDGFHEPTIREMAIDRGGIRVGEPLKAFRGVLTGVPEYTGVSEPLMDSAKATTGESDRG
ncbi:MAG: ATPase domain-containing protein, partial [Gemmatimonadales bacterium]